MSIRYGGGFEEWLKKTVEVLRNDFHVSVACGTIGAPLVLSSSQANERLKDAVAIDYISFLQITFTLIMLSYFRKHLYGP
jgi:hypothetical protein